MPTYLRAEPETFSAWRDEIPRSYPERRRWRNPVGWGAQHANDQTLFTLWNETAREFHYPLEEEGESWIRNIFGDGDLVLAGWLICITTACPPVPISADHPNDAGDCYGPWAVI